MIGFVKAILVCISMTTATHGIVEKNHQATQCFPTQTLTLDSIMNEILSENLNDINDTFYSTATAEEESKLTRGVLILDASIISSSE